MSNETYLGDGLYASFDGYQIVLRAPRERGDHFVALEPAVVSSPGESPKQKLGFPILFMGLSLRC